MNLKIFLTKCILILHLDELDEIRSVASTTKSNGSRMIVITEGEVNKIEVISEEDEEIEYCAQDVQDII